MRGCTLQKKPPAACYLAAVHARVDLLLCLVWIPLHRWQPCAATYWSWRMDGACRCWPCQPAPTTPSRKTRRRFCGEQGGAAFLCRHGAHEAASPCAAEACCPRASWGAATAGGRSHGCMPPPCQPLHQQTAAAAPPHERSPAAGTSIFLGVAQVSSFFPPAGGTSRRCTTPTSTPWSTLAVAACAAPWRRSFDGCQQLLWVP